MYDLTHTIIVPVVVYVALHLGHYANVWTCFRPFFHHTGLRDTFSFSFCGHCTAYCEVSDIISTNGPRSITQVRGC